MLSKSIDELEAPDVCGAAFAGQSETEAFIDLMREMGVREIRLDKVWKEDFPLAEAFEFDMEYKWELLEMVLNVAVGFRLQPLCATVVHRAGWVTIRFEWDMKLQCGGVRG